MAFRLFLAAALSLALAAAFAPHPMTKLAIEVKNYEDKHLERASVIVTFIEGRDYMKLGKKDYVHYELKTNMEGVAHIPPIPQGKIKVQVIAKGYQTFGQVFDINEEERTVEVKLQAPQQPYSAHE